MPPPPTTNRWHLVQFEGVDFGNNTKVMCTNLVAAVVTDEQVPEKKKTALVAPNSNLVIECPYNLWPRLKYDFSQAFYFNGGASRC